MDKSCVIINESVVTIVNNYKAIIKAKKMLKKDKAILAAVILAQLQKGLLNVIDKGK